MSAFLSFVRCLDVGVMFVQDVNISSGGRSMQYNELSGAISTTKHGVFRPHLLSEVYHMIPVWESLIFCQFFEHHAKVSSDMLRSILPFHCSSRDILTCENMVSNWSVIAFWTETVRKRSPQTVVFVKKCSQNFRLYCRTVASSWISHYAWIRLHSRVSEIASYPVSRPNWNHATPQGKKTCAPGGLESFR